MWSIDAHARRHFGERAVAIVAIQPAGIPQVIEEQIRVAVVVEIDPGTSLAAAFWLALHACPCGDFLERAVSLVVIETVFLSLASDEQVDPAIIIIIAPACGDGIDRGEQPGFLGDVAESRRSPSFRKSVGRTGQMTQAPRRMKISRRPSLL